MSDVVLTAIITAIVGVGTVLLKYMLDNGSKLGALVIILFIFLAIVFVLRVNNRTDSSGKRGTENGPDSESVSIFPPDDEGGTEEEPPRISEQISLLQLEPYTYAPYSGGNPPFAEVNSPKDIFGKSYQTALQAFSPMTDGERYRVYRLDGKYDIFTCTLAIPENCKGTSDYLGSLFIYTDNKLCKKYTEIKTSNNSIPIEISVQGVKDLKIEMYGDGQFSIYGGISPMLCDPTLFIKN